MPKNTEEKPSELAVGDIVTLQSGGPSLTVAHIVATMTCPMVRAVGVTESHTIDLMLPMMCFMVTASAADRIE